MQLGLRQDGRPTLRGTVKPFQHFYGPLGTCAFVVLVFYLLILYGRGNSDVSLNQSRFSIAKTLSSFRDIRSCHFLHSQLMLFSESMQYIRPDRVNHCVISLCLDMDEYVLAMLPDTRCLIARDQTSSVF